MNKPGLERIRDAIEKLEAQRGLIDDDTLDTAIRSLKDQLAEASDPKEDVNKFREERKLVTIMFADVSGFTSLSEGMDPERIREMMNNCFDALVLVIERFGGTVDKYIGDEIMALFGATVTSEYDAERALFAAL